MKLLLVVNPVSGGVDKDPFLKDAKALCDNYGIENQVFKTTGTDDAEALKVILNTFKPDKVAAVGGDGTLLFLAIVLQHSSIPVGIIPMGSANGMATELEVSKQPIEALKELIMSEIVGDLDLLVVNNEHYCIHLGDVGINAKIVKGYENDHKRGMSTYAKYFIDELGKVTAFPMTVECNEKTYDAEGVMLCICNARKYGTGIPINLEGNPMDGVFEIVLIKEINGSMLINAGLSSFNENFINSQHQTSVQTNQAKITFKTPQLLQLDGEVIGEFLSFDVRIIKGAVKLITTQKNPYLKR